MTSLAKGQHSRGDRLEPRKPPLPRRAARRLGAWSIGFRHACRPAGADCGRRLPLGTDERDLMAEQYTETRLLDLLAKMTADSLEASSLDGGR